MLNIRGATPPLLIVVVYLIRIFLPARMLLPLILFSFFSFLTVVPLRLAISESVSPWRIVTLRPPRLLFLFFLLFLLLREFRLEELFLFLDELVVWRL